VIEVADTEMLLVYYCDTNGRNSKRFGGTFDSLSTRNNFLSVKLLTLKQYGLFKKENLTERRYNSRLLCEV